MNPQAGPFRAGHVALVGRPNVGKSSLLNALVGERLCIVSPKPQTTRHRILGVVTREHGQIGYLDTPGLHQANVGKALNRQLNRTAQATLAESDVNVHVVEALRYDAEDRAVAKAVFDTGAPVLLAINKIDTVKDKALLLPYIAERGAEAYRGVYLVSARRRDGLEALESAIIGQLPEREPLYEADTLTDRSERFLAAELVREQLMRQLGQELPYATTVEIERYALEGRLRRIHAAIWVERDSQKGIVIGNQGSRLREIGTQARQAMERLFNGKVHLELWVKVRSGWSDDDRALTELGIRE